MSEARCRGRWLDFDCPAPRTPGDSPLSTHSPLFCLGSSLLEVDHVTCLRQAVIVFLQPQGLVQSEPVGSGQTQVLLLLDLSLDLVLQPALLSGSSP